MRWRLAAVLLLLVSLGLWAWRASGQVLPNAPWLSWQHLLPNLVVALGAGVVVAAIAAGIGRLSGRRPPWFFLGAWVASALLLATMGAAGALRGWWLITVIVLLAVPALVISLGSLRVKGRTVRAVATGSVAALTLVAVAGWLAWPGPGNGSDVQAAAPTHGPHRVEQLRYGTGTDLPTTPVDASGIITGWSPALTQAWGFDASALPLDAVVWRPEDVGNYPLVLAVHGNFTAGSSEEGFDYLGSALASRGYVVVSVDQNFLNTGVIGGATQGLDQARPWLLHQHLQLWHESPPIPGLVDTSAIALLGHSRGGEAVAAAAATSPVPVHSVIALAPSDGLVSTTPVVLDDLSYLTMAGSYDADVNTFAGARQYARTTPGEGQIKIAIALDAMNHTQFNSRWGRYDGALGLARHVLSTGTLVTPQTQREVAATQISWFLDRTLKGDDNPQPTLPVETRQQARTGGSIELTSAGSRGGDVRTVPLPTRVGTSDNEVLHLVGNGTIEQDFTLPADATTATGRGLSLDVADATNRDQPLQVSVRVTDRSGTTATLPWATCRDRCPAHTPRHRSSCRPAPMNRP